MIRELEMIVLKHDIPEYGLRGGDIGVVVHSYSPHGSEKAGYEVEFVTAEGKTIALLTLRTPDIRAMNSSEILHVREFSQAA